LANGSILPLQIHVRFECLFNNDHAVALFTHRRRQIIAKFSLKCARDSDVVLDCVFRGTKGTAAAGYIHRSLRENHILNIDVNISISIHTFGSI
jgi:hypothetical protein